jgi:hypothetical protein
MRIFYYLYAYLKNDSKQLRDEASKAAREWIVGQGRGTPHYTDSYRKEFTSFSRAYINSYLHIEAKRFMLSKKK